MTTSVRYQNVQNTLGIALTSANFPYLGDGDDKQFKVIKRQLSAADIGIGAGQIGNASGAIIGVAPSTANVLWIEALIYRPATALGNGSTPYDNITGRIFPVGATPVNTITQVKVQVYLGLDNTINAIDISQGTTAALAIGDYIIAKLFVGAPVDPSDRMN